MENLINKLKTLGFSEKDAKVYETILRAKKATVINLARGANVKRTTVYHCLDSLMEAGLVNKTEQNGHKYFYAEDPKESLQTLLKNKEEEIKNLIPDLRKIFGTGLYQPEIRTYRHQSGIRKILEETLKTKELTARYYLSGANLEEMVGEKFVEDFVKKRVATGLRSLSLRSSKYKPKREKGILHSKMLREVKFIPDEMIIKPYICIFDDKVAMISTKEEKLGFIIRSREFAEAQKAIFDMIWENAAI